MRRLSIVMAVAALDTYIHRLILAHVYDHGELPGGLASLSVPFRALLDQADETKKAASASPHAVRPRVGVKRVLRDRLLLETFQSADGVSRGLAMAGLGGRWKDIERTFTPSMQSKDIKARLDDIVSRRNQIVHEGDYRRLERPRDSTKNGMTFEQASADIEFVARLVDAIHALRVTEPA